MFEENKKCISIMDVLRDTVGYFYIYVSMSDILVSCVHIPNESSYLHNICRFKDQKVWMRKFNSIFPVVKNDKIKSLMVGGLMVIFSNHHVFFYCPITGSLIIS